MNRHERRRAMKLNGKIPPMTVLRSDSRFGQSAKGGLPPAAASEMQRQVAAFKAKFGRAPRPEDPIFFDPDAPGPDPVAMDEGRLRKMFADGLRKRGSREHIVRAFEKTGFMITTEDADRVGEPKLTQWRKAVADSIKEIRSERGSYDPETGK